MSKWSHLPNAKYIDQVIASLKADPTGWAEAYCTVYGAAYGAAYSAAYDALTLPRFKAWDATRNEGYDAAYDAILALIAYDNCAYFLQEKPENVELLAALGIDGAMLLLTACRIFNKENSYV